MIYSVVLNVVMVGVILLLGRVFVFVLQYFEEYFEDVR